MYTVCSVEAKDGEEIAAAILAAVGNDVGKPVAIAVVNQAGDLVYFWAMPGTSPASIVIAQNKAYTAVRLGRATADIARELSAQNQPPRNPALYTDPRITTFPGAVPIIVDSTTVGGVGVSGRKGMREESDTFDGDHELGLAGINAWKLQQMS